MKFTTRDFWIHQPAVNQAVDRGAEQFGSQCGVDAFGYGAGLLSALDPALHVATLRLVRLGDVGTELRAGIDARVAQQIHRTHLVRRFFDKAIQGVGDAAQCLDTTVFPDRLLYAANPVRDESVVQMREQPGLGRSEEQTSEL